MDNIIGYETTNTVLSYSHASICIVSGEPSAINRHTQVATVETIITLECQVIYLRKNPILAILYCARCNPICSEQYITSFLSTQLSVKIEARHQNQ